MVVCVDAAHQCWIQQRRSIQSVSQFWGGPPKWPSQHLTKFEMWSQPHLLFLSYEWHTSLCGVCVDLGSWCGFSWILCCNRMYTNVILDPCCYCATSCPCRLNAYSCSKTLMLYSSQFCWNASVTQVWKHLPFNAILSLSFRFHVYTLGLYWAYIKCLYK